MPHKSIPMTTELALLWSPTLGAWWISKWNVLDFRIFILYFLSWLLNFFDRQTAQEVVNIRETCTTPELQASTRTAEEFMLTVRFSGIYTATKTESTLSHVKAMAGMQTGDHAGLAWSHTKQTLAANSSQVADNEIQYCYNIAGQRITFSNWQRNETAQECMFTSCTDGIQWGPPVCLWKMEYINTIFSDDMVATVAGPLGIIKLSGSWEQWGGLMGE